MIIGHIVAAKQWGGGEQYVYDICKQFADKGHRNYIFLDKNNKMLANKFAEVAQVVGVNLSSFLGLGAYNLIKKEILKHNIEILCSHSGHLAFLGAVLRNNINTLKFVAFRHNAQPNKHDIYHGWLRKQFDAVICVSKLVYDLQVNSLEVENIRKWHLVYSGIDTKKFTGKYVSKNMDVFAVGYAGRLVEDKGIEILLKAVPIVLASNKNMKIVLKIAGEGKKEYKNRLNCLIRTLNIENQVEFLGHQDDMKGFYESLDVFVLPSIVSEAFGLVLCEAMYCMVPVVSTLSGAQKEIIANRDYGILVTPGNIEELACAINYLIIHKNERQQIGENGKKLVEEKFTVLKCVNCLESIFFDVIKNGNNGESL